MVRVKSLEIQNDNLEEIARTSAFEATRRNHLPIIVEDAGLFVNALKGFPGPYSAYAHRTIGNEGILKILKNHQDRGAYFKSVIVFCEPSEPLKVFDGVTEGRIVAEIRGSKGFGFDPIFEPFERRDRTFAEISMEEKNKISHRAKALTKFAEWYKKKGETQQSF